MQTTLVIIICVLTPFLSYSQNIGIGTNTPTRARLEINGGVGRTVGIFGGEGPGISLQKEYPAIGFNQYFDGGASRYIGNGNAAVAWFNPGLGTLNVDMFSNGAANAVATGSRVLTLTGTGNVGIGTAGTNGQLQLNNELRNRKIVLYEAANNDNQYYGFGINNGALRYQVDATAAAHKFYAGNGSGSSLFLMGIAGNRKVLIGEQAQGFKVGINSYDPAYTLELVEANGTGLLIVDPAHNYYNWELRCDLYGPTSNALTLYYNENSTPKGWFRPDTGGYSSNSDNRLKKDILGMEAILPKLMQLKPSRYHFKDDQQQRDCMGFIAQEVKMIFPELVDVREGGKEGIPGLHGISYSEFGVIAIKAIQEQQKHMEKMQQEIDLLKEQNRMLLQIQGIINN